jgi:hypothetical protein
MALVVEMLEYSSGYRGSGRFSGMVGSVVDYIN